MKNAFPGRGWLTGMGLPVVAVALVALTAVAQTDDLDEIRKLERLAEDLRVTQTETVKAREMPAPRAATADPASLARQLHQAEGELAAAKAEIGRLKQEMAMQEERHRVELQHAYYNMGCVYRACKQFDRAEQEFVRALEIDPTDAAVHYNLGILYEDDLANKQKAREHYLKFIELAPNDKDVALVKEWLSSMQ